MSWRRKDSEEYFGGRIKGLVELVAGFVANDPGLAKELDRLHATVAASAEGYGKRDKCFNCKRSMKVTVYTADLHDALLLLAMARQVRLQLHEGLSFTAANRVHIPTLRATHATLKRNTKCDYLGLIKQPEKIHGSGYWVVTSWGWAALRGDPIPKSAKYWEGHLLGRSTETTTLAQMFSTHRETVERAIIKSRQVRSDYRGDFIDYHPSEWSQFGGTIEEEQRPVFAS